jgi:hypothetical protein
MKILDNNLRKRTDYNIEKYRQKWKEHVQLMSADRLHRAAAESR